MKYVCSLNGKKYEVVIEKVDDFSPLTYGQAAAPAPAAAPVVAPAGAGESVTAPMPGNVLDVLVAVGAKVSAGDAVVLLEAMKMENEIVAPCDGTVTSISVKKGDVVDTDAVLFTVG